MRVTPLTGLALVSGCLLALPACSSGRGSSSPVVTAPATTAPVTTPATTVAPPTTVYAPTAPQATPDGAAARLVSAWSSGDRAEAASVAAPAAVTALLAVPYPTGSVQSRGCTDATTDPGTCTYRNTSTETLYQFTVTRAAGGWYVSAVTPES